MKLPARLICLLIGSISVQHPARVQRALDDFIRPRRFTTQRRRK